MYYYKLSYTNSQKLCCT